MVPREGERYMGRGELSKEKNRYLLRGTGI